MNRSRLQDYADRAADWRHRAEKLRALAKATPQPDAKAELLDLAFQWDQLAEKAETGRAAASLH